MYLFLNNFNYEQNKIQLLLLFKEVEENLTNSDEENEDGANSVFGIGAGDEDDFDEGSLNDFSNS